ncbi:thiamine phosphate synthase [Flagellimonas sp. 389]|uniref:thiamine phosphate synthase n=1 Tax=Flagellimonas sp. 389 TaxID=2835862 RepID=UPI001BD3AD8F|nr:thiamine phosphate synthase [Flagellimonas sp. 389]MBS9462917.1 thiamine phosphate synthase [Flagellimonas sp. 389]
MKNHKYISRVHYITQDHPDKSHQQLALEACMAGVDLVQLRLKNRSHSEVLDIALETQKICKEYGATFIVNDHLEIAKEINADGVHLGKSDENHITARKLLGDDKIIGGTAYNEKEALLLKSAGIVDYIGLGTFRKTETKPEITDFLSLDQIGQLIESIGELNDSSVPILVIGGVGLEDIRPLLSKGVYGIAIASLINHSNDKFHIMNEIRKNLNRKYVING